MSIGNVRLCTDFALVFEQLLYFAPLIAKVVLS